MRRTSLAAATAALALVVAGATPAAADPEPDRPIIAGDQAGPRILILDPAVTDWDSPAAIEWEWEPTTALGFSAAEIAAFGRVTDFELRHTADGPQMAVTASYGLAALISYPAGERLWAQILPASANLHGVEILPDGNVAITSTNTSSGWVRVYAASQGPNASTYAQYPLGAQSHGALWDPITERLWIVGKDGPDPDDPRIITALAVTGSPAQPRLTEDATKWHELPDIGSHDLTADPSDPDVLLVALDATAWEFDKTAGSNEFTQIPAAAGGLAKLKAISRQPSGQTVVTRPDHYKVPVGPCEAINYWCTDTVEFFGPDTTRTMTGAQFYRARVLSPDYSAIGDTVHGPVSDRSLPSGGSWSSPTQFESNTGVTAIAAAALADGTLHMFSLVPGDGVWYRERSAGGTWSAGTRIDANASITAISAAALPDGTIHVQTVVPGSGVWDRTRSAAGTWSSASKIADGCLGTGANDPCIADLSSAALPDGTLHVQTLVPGDGVYDRTRSTSGTWSAPVLIDANDGISRISATALANGTLHVQTIVPGFGVWDRTRSTAGSWSSASKVTGDSTIFAVSGAGLPGSKLHLGTAGYTQ